MLLGAPNPGSWQIFLKRPDNIGLSLQEAKQKYLKELALFENEQRKKRNLYLQMIQNQGGGGFTGQGIDGPIAGATVLAVNERKSTTTDSNGFFTFNFIPSGDIEITGGTDAITGVAFTGKLKAPKGSTIISPITTAIKEIMDTGKSENQATAEFFEFAAKVYDINIPASKRERIKKENFIDLAAGDGDFLKVVGLATTLESAAEVAGEAAHRAASGKTLNNAKESFYSQIGSLCRDNDFLSISTDENSKNTFKNTLMRVDSNVSTTNAQAIREALDNQLSRVKEIVNDSNMDKEFGVTSIMAQNRLAKREIKADVTALYAGTYTTTQIKSRSENIVGREAEEYQNLGTIFEGTTNKEEPSIESQVNLYPEAVDYVTADGENKYAQGELTRSLETKINGLPTYSGTINGESTFLWYSRNDRVWVIDNNLEAPYIALADSKRSYPITGNYTNRSTEAVIIIAETGVYEDQPSGGGQGQNTIDSLNSRGAIRWDSAGRGETNRETGVTTWQVTGKVIPASINERATEAYFRGAFTITLNEGSEQYVIGLGSRGVELVDGQESTSLTVFNMGVTLGRGQEINLTEPYTPELVSGTYT